MSNHDWTEEDVRDIVQFQKWSGTENQTAKQLFNLFGDMIEWEGVYRRNIPFVIFQSRRSAEVFKKIFPHWKVSYGDITEV